MHLLVWPRDTRTGTTSETNPGCPGTVSGTAADNLYVPGTCQVCRDPQRAEIDSALDHGTALSAIAGRTAHSKSSLHRHSQHRADRDRVAGRLVALAQPAESKALQQVLPLNMRPIARFHRRLVELADDTRRVAELAAATRDPRLYLAAVRSESDQLHALAKSFPEDPDSLVRRDVLLDVLADALRGTISDPTERSAFSRQVAADLSKVGLR